MELCFHFTRFNVTVTRHGIGNQIFEFFLWVCQIVAIHILSVSFSHLQFTFSFFLRCPPSSLVTHIPPILKHFHVYSSAHLLALRTSSPHFLMGILYSHLVFQPPSPPTYADHAGLMTFRTMSTDPSDSTHSPSSSQNQPVTTHPVFYITTSKQNVIPAAYFHYQQSYYTILFSHVRFFIHSLSFILYPLSSISRSFL